MKQVNGKTPTCCSEVPVQEQVKWTRDQVAQNEKTCSIGGFDLVEVLS